MRRLKYKKKKGQALVEFAIILPIILMVLMGILQFGMILNAYLTISNASREGARTGIMGSSDVEIKNMVIADSVILNSQNLAVTITPSEANRKSGDTLTVNVRYNYKLTIPIISSLFQNIVLSEQTSMRVE